MFITLHSFGQYWMLPWGYTAALPSDYADLEKVSQAGASALKAVYGISTLNALKNVKKI
jgi:hypothetical protein